MEEYLIQLVLRELDRLRELIVQRKCVRNKEDVENILNLLAHEPMSLEDTLSCLNEEGKKMGVPGTWSRSKLYEAIDNGIMPRQHHCRGFKAGAWYRDEVLMALAKLKDS